MDYQAMKWTETQGRMAKELCQAGKTAAQIGAVVKKTRSAVIGYLNRNGIKMSEVNGIITEKKVKRQTVVNVKKIGVIHNKVQFFYRQTPDLRKIQSTPQRIEAYSSAKEKGMIGIPFLKAAEGQCRFIVQDQPVVFVCGDPTVRVGCSWCEKHYEIVFIKPEPRKPTNQTNRQTDGKLGRYRSTIMAR